MKIGKAELKRRLSALKGREFRVSGDTDEKTDDEILSAGLDATKGGIFGGFDSEKFILEQGVVLAHVKHKGSGEFSISFLSSKIWQKDYNHDKWDHEGELDDYAVIRVCDQDKTSDLRPGEHNLEVRAPGGRWSVHLIQPELGQASESIISDEIEKPFEELVGEGHYVLPPMITGNKPVIAKAQHKGRAGFLVRATSVDGTHEVTIFDRKGQFFEEGSRADLIPGKEYILEIFADGEWNVDFSEGY